MISRIIEFSVRNKFVIVILVLIMASYGIYSMLSLPIDAVPDITNNQVQVVTTSSSLAPQEVEQFITSPVEMAVANIPDVIEIRSISRFGLSVVTIVFEDHVPILDARQFVREQLGIAESYIPAELGQPEMMPITTGLGEIYQYTLQADPGYRHNYDPMKLRTIQDWIVKRQLSGIPGIIEVSSFGGFVRQYEVAVDPLRLKHYDLTISDVLDALQANNQNSGGSYIEKGNSAFYIRTEGLVSDISEIESIVIRILGRNPVLIDDVAKVKWGYPPRYGAMTMDGRGETVGGITLMLKGANSNETIQLVQERIEQIQGSLPEGIRIVPYLDRSELVGKTVNTVSSNLIKGGLIVILILFLLLGNFRAALIVASVIPLSMLFAFILMGFFGVSANLMSLGAIDFGIVVDGAVIVVESILHAVFTLFVGKRLTQSEMDSVVIDSTTNMIKSAAFGVFIILVVFIPILTLQGIEGKMFVPMAQTFSFVLMGALVLSVTYVPMMAALVLKREIHTHRTLADRIIGKIRNWYRYTLEFALRIPYTLIAFTVLLLAGTILLFVNLGSVFIPTLEEGDLAMQMTIKPGSSLKESIRTTTKAEKLLLERFPEVEHVVSKIGTAEVPTDPMAVEDADIMIILKEKNEWVSAKDREELADLMKAALMDIKGAEFEFTQPIQLRFNELMTGVKTDVAIKLFGEDLDELSRQAYRVEDLIRDIPGSGDIRVERTEGLPQMKIRFKRDKMALYGLDIRELNEIIRAAYAGQTAGIVYEGERRFDLVVRLQDSFRDQLKLGKLFVSTPKGFLIPMTEVAEIELTTGPMQISREDARRRISIGVNVRNRDIASYIEAVKKKLQSELELPPGYYIKYGGQFENLEAARKRLSIAIPVALLLIFFLLYFAFRSIRYAAMIYIAIPTAAIGGVAALAIRGMPFSISAGVGFIALFGVAVLNGIVLLSYYNQLSKKGELNIRDLVIEGGLVRMRPVILTAAVASFGFLPMALSTTAGAEVQKPLATVVIGGLITSTFLTLVLLPLIYYLTEKRKYLAKAGAAAVVFLFVLQGNHELSAQISSMQQAVDSAMVNNLMIQNAYLEMEASAYEKQTALELGPTELNVMYGNINTAVDDRYLEIKQNFGNPLQQAKKTGELQAMTEVRNAELEQVKREIKRDTRLTWQKLAFHSAMIRLLDDQVNIFIEYLPYVESKVFEGEISRNDYNLIMVKMSRLENELTRNRIEYANAIADLRTLTMAKGDIALTDTVYTIMPLILFDTITVDPSLFDRFTAQISFSEKVISTARAGYFPLLNLGYFNQQLEQVNGFDGLIAEAHFPLWFRPKAKAVKQAKVQYELALNQYQFARLLINRQNQTWRNRLNEYVKLYNHYGEDWDEQAERLITNSRIQLESGEINYIEFMYEYASAMETIVDQMELIRNINEAILQLEYYQNR